MTKKASPIKRKAANVRKKAPADTSSRVPNNTPQSILPSDLTQVTEDQLGDALANLRREARNARGDDLQAIQNQRDNINKRLDQFVALSLASIDADPLLRRKVAELGGLTLEIQRAVRKMQTVKKAINNAVKIVGFADKFLKLVTKMTA
jgi:hypothetical protein